MGMKEFSSVTCLGQKSQQLRLNKSTDAESESESESESKVEDHRRLSAVMLMTKQSATRNTSPPSRVRVRVPKSESQSQSQSLSPSPGNSQEAKSWTCSPSQRRMRSAWKPSAPPNVYIDSMEESPRGQGTSARQPLIDSPSLGFCARKAKP